MIEKRTVFFFVVVVDCAVCDCFLLPQEQFLAVTSP